MYSITVLGIAWALHRLIAHTRLRGNHIPEDSACDRRIMAAQGPVIFWTAVNRRPLL